MAINVKDKLVTLESLGVAYSAEQDAREEADQALSTRIDNIVAPDGDPSLTEVSDARVSGSTTYNTLKARLDADKAAIGTEISQLSADLITNFKSIIGINNLFNSATWTAGNISASGEIGSTSGFHYSSLIPVIAGAYTFMWTSPASMGTIRVHGYDSEGAWVRQITYFSSGSGNTYGTIKITVGSDISYVRFSLATGNTSLVFIEGDTIQEKFDAIEEDFDTLGKVADSAQTLTLNRIKSINTIGTWSGNVYTMNGVTFTVGDDFSVVVNGTASAAATLRLYSATLTEDTKVLVINPSVNASDDVYVCRMAPNGAIEKYSKGTSERVLPTGLQRVMIRIESGKSASNLTVKRPYLLTGTLTDFALTDEVTDEFKNIVNYIPYQRYSYTGNISTPSELKTAYSADNLLEAIYAFCDELMETYPNFVTKETLSYTGNIVSSVSDLPDPSTITNGTIYMVEVEGGYHQYICNNGAWVQMYTWDNNGNQIYLVKLTYPMYAYTISPYSGCNYPIIVWCSGLHGSEDWSNVSTLYLFKELLANRGQNDDIDYLLSNFVIKIVPCCGVSACADRTLGPHAMSENGVNPNRDFPVYWEMSADEWHRTGNVPWYDPYNRILKSYLEGLTNVVYCVNKHDSNTLTSDAFVNNVWDNYISANLVEDRIFKQLDLTIKTKYPWLLSEFVGTGVTWTPNSRSLCKAQYVYGTHGSFEQWYNSIGIKGGLIETVCKTGTAYSDAGHDADFYRIALECDVMTLCAIAKNIKTLSISDELNIKFS